MFTIREKIKKSNGNDDVIALHSGGYNQLHDKSFFGLVYHGVISWLGVLEKASI